MLCVKLVVGGGRGRVGKGWYLLLYIVVTKMRRCVGIFFYI